MQRPAATPGLGDLSVVPGELMLELLPLPLATCSRSTDFKIMQLGAACIIQPEQLFLPLNPANGSLWRLVKFEPPKFNIYTLLRFILVDLPGLKYAAQQTIEWSA